jgi:hypothetical protein
MNWLLDTDVICQPVGSTGSMYQLQVWAEQERILEKAGLCMPVEDSYIAATARRHGLTIATGNERDFRRPGIKVFDPFKELA